MRALHQRVDPECRFSVIDATEAAGPADPRWVTEARRVLAEENGVVVLRHLERLHGVALRVLSAALEGAVATRLVWVCGAGPGNPPTGELERLLHLFPSTVCVPPLRHHVEDVEQLVPFLLLRLGCSGQLTFSPEAMQLLLRSSWPGNVQQLLDVLRFVLRHRRTGLVVPADLPPETQARSRRRLSTLESMERDALVLALQDAAGNKAAAARALGMSRATIYRKIHEYGIDPVG